MTTCEEVLAAVVMDQRNEIKELRGRLEQLPALRHEYYAAYYNDEKVEDIVKERDRLKAMVYQPERFNYIELPFHKFFLKCPQGFPGSAHQFFQVPD